jgi:hypothetical protein
MTRDSDEKRRANRRVPMYSSRCSADEDHMRKHFAYEILFRHRGLLGKALTPDATRNGFLESHRIEIGRRQIVELS